MRAIRRQVFENPEYKAFHYKHQLEWNPMLLAILKGHLHIVKYLSAKLKVHLRSTIAISKCKRTDNEKHAPPLLFCLLCCLMDPNNSDKEQIFKHLWTSFDFVWDYECLLNALLMLLTFHRSDLVDFMMKSWTMQSIFLSFSHNFRIQFLSRFIDGFLYLSNGDKKLEKVFRKNIVKVRSYQSTALIYYLYNMNQDKHNDLMGLAMIFVKSKDRLRNIIVKNPTIASCMYRLVEKEFGNLYLGCNEDYEKKIKELKKTFEDIGVKDIMTVEEIEMMNPVGKRATDTRSRGHHNQKSSLNKGSSGDGADDNGSVISFKDVHGEDLSHREKNYLIKSTKDLYFDQEKLSDG